MKATSLSANAGFDFRRRTSGILLHITSLPGPHGSGDLGPPAYRFVEFLAAAGQTWWQMLPVGPPGRAPGFSPYDSASAFAGSPWLISLTDLARQGLLPTQSLEQSSGLATGPIDFDATLPFREARLREAFSGFARAGGQKKTGFRAFCRANAYWLEDFALFAALRREAQGTSWTEWDEAVRDRQPRALREVRRRLAAEMAGHRFVQYEFDRQWRALRSYAHRRGIGLIGDLPIFVGHDSADVWSRPELFRLDQRGQALWVSGYPPDRFNRRGQLWGHPQYDWRRHEATEFAWWLRRLDRSFELFDAVRIDHFLGFTRTWSIPARAAEVRRGRWVKSPGDKLFAAVRRKLGAHPMIAEDLGHVTAADVQLRESAGLAPMRIFQFGFDCEPGSAEHLPHNYARLCTAYTGNHDNNTTVGWFRQLRPAQRERVLTYTGGSESAPHLGAMRAVMASPANTVICPMQDVLGLDEQARMNVPGRLAANWCWRLPSIKLKQPARQLRALVEAFGRTPAARRARRRITQGRSRP